MSCECSNVPEVLYLEEAPKGFQDSLVQQDMQNWMRLFQCGALWAIDEWDKYQWQVAFRIQVREAWASADREPQRKHLLLRSRGGITAEPCIWAGCQGRRVSGVAYCIDHLYAAGARK